MFLFFKWNKQWYSKHKKRQTGASSRPSWDRQQPDLHHVLQTRAPGICMTQSVQIHSDHLLFVDMKRCLWCCTTQRFLSHSLSAPNNTEHSHSVKPYCWKTCFHYVNPVVTSLKPPLQNIKNRDFLTSLGGSTIRAIMTSTDNFRYQQLCREQNTQNCKWLFSLFPNMYCRIHLELCLEEKKINWN